MTKDEMQGTSVLPSVHDKSPFTNTSNMGMQKNPLQKFFQGPLQTLENFAMKIMGQPH